MFDSNYSDPPCDVEPKSAQFCSYDLLARMREIADANIEMARMKNADYAGVSGNDPFANFKACEKFGVPVEIGMLVRMSDKFARIGNLLKQGAPAVKNESIADTLNDLAVYATLLRIYLEQK